MLIHPTLGIIFPNQNQHFTNFFKLTKTFLKNIISILIEKKIKWRLNGNDILVTVLHLKACSAKLVTSNLNALQKSKKTVF